MRKLIIYFYVIPGYLYIVLRSLIKSERYVYVNTNNIGHFGIDLQIVAKENASKLVVPYDNCCNVAVKRHYEIYGILFVHSHYLFRVVAMLRWLPFVTFAYLYSTPRRSTFLGKTFFIGKNRTNFYEPILNTALFTPILGLDSYLNNFSDKNIVLVSFRDSDDDGTYRNTSKQLALSSIYFALESGFVVIRIGGTREYDVGHSSYFDYQFSKYKSAENDLYLIAQKYKFIGDSSGICSFRQYINEFPCLFINFAPTSFLPKHHKSYVIHKRMELGDLVSHHPDSEEYWSPAHAGSLFHDVPFGDISSAMEHFLEEKYDLLDELIDHTLTSAIRRDPKAFGYYAKGAVLETLRICPSVERRADTP